MKTRTDALSAYGKLVGDQGRLVHRHWILGETVPNASILDAPEIGPVEDASSMYESARNMRLVPIGKKALAMVLVPLALPMIAVAALKIPIGELLLNVFRAVL